MDTLKVCTTFVVFELGQLQLNQSILKWNKKESQIKLHRWYKKLKILNISLFTKACFRTLYSNYNSLHILMLINLLKT